MIRTIVENDREYIKMPKKEFIKGEVLWVILAIGMAIIGYGVGTGALT